MKTVALTVITVSLLGTYGQGALAADYISGRAQASDVVIFESDKGIYGTSPVRTEANVAVQVDAAQILFPHESAIAIDGKVAVTSFANARAVLSTSTSGR